MKSAELCLLMQLWAGQQSLEVTQFLTRWKDLKQLIEMNASTWGGAEGGGGGRGGGEVRQGIQNSCFPILQSQFMGLPFLPFFGCKTLFNCCVIFFYYFYYYLPPTPCHLLLSHFLYTSHSCFLSLLSFLHFTCFSAFFPFFPFLLFLTLFPLNYYFLSI